MKDGILKEWQEDSVTSLMIRVAPVSAFLLSRPTRWRLFSLVFPELGELVGMNHLTDTGASE
jgi:hypothetical protein